MCANANIVRVWGHMFCELVRMRWYMKNRQWVLGVVWIWIKFVRQKFQYKSIIQKVVSCQMQFWFEYINNNWPPCITPRSPVFSVEYPFAFTALSKGAGAQHISNIANYVRCKLRRASESALNRARYAQWLADAGLGIQSNLWHDAGCLLNVAIRVYCR